jgi:hypothetical protein
MSDFNSELSTIVPEKLEWEWKPFVSVGPVRFESHVYDLFDTYTSNGWPMIYSKEEYDFTT